MPRLDDARARLARHDLLDIAQRTDGGTLAGRVHKAHGRIDLRPHRSRREVQLAQLIGSHVVEPALRRGPPTLVHRFHIGGHHEKIGVDVPGQQLAGEILVDDGLDPAEGSLTAGHPGGRDATPAGADDEHTVLQEPPDRADLEDSLGRR